MGTSGGTAFVIARIAMILIFGMYYPDGQEPWRQAVRRTNVEDVVKLTKMIVGESYHLIKDQKGMAGVAMVHVAFNNMKHQNHDLDKELKRWYGYNPDIQITEEDKAVVITGIALFRMGYDYTAGARYMLSARDMENLGFDKSKATVAYEYGVWGLYALREWQEVK